MFVIINGIICIHYGKVSQCIYRLQYSYKFMEVRGRYATIATIRKQKGDRAKRKKMMFALRTLY